MGFNPGFKGLISLYSEISPFFICSVTWNCSHSLLTRERVDQVTAQNYALGGELYFVMAIVITAEGKRKYNIKMRVFVRERGGGERERSKFGKKKILR
jgi:hypothetical protein